MEKGKEGSGIFNEVMRYESKKRLGSVTHESDYIRTWVINSGRKLARVLCKDVSLLRGI